MPAKVHSWKVEETRKGKFLIAASYQFQIDERLHEARCTFNKPVYPNPYLAQESIDLWKNSRWKVWYRPSDPTSATLQKQFPFKGAVHMFVCLGVFFYFIWLQGRAQTA